MSTTTNFELENMARYFNLPLICVVQKDQLHQYDHINNAYYIINNQSSSDGSGTHWTCLYLNKKESFFFCSYGAPPSKEIIIYVKQFSKHLRYNNFIIQSLNSNNCGYYTIGFMLFMEHNNYNYMQFITAFDDDVERNDLILEGIMRIYLPKQRPLKELSRFLNLKYIKSKI